MSDWEFTRSLAKAVTHESVLDERRRLDKLCERLGINTDGCNYADKWMLVGRALANEEPEFRLRGPGRPKMDDPLDGIDVQRAGIVIEIAKSMAGYQGLPPLSRAKWVSEIKKCVDNSGVADKGRHLFGTTEKALQRSVKEGVKNLNVPEGLFAKK
jgi:hypothetical protein